MVYTLSYPVSGGEAVVWVVVAFLMAAYAISEERRRRRAEADTAATILELTKSTERNKGVLDTIALLGSRNLEVLLEGKSQVATSDSKGRNLLSSLDEVLHEVLVGQSSTLSPFGRLAYLRRREHDLWQQLETAAQEDKHDIAEKLMVTLRQQLEIKAFQAPSQKAQEQTDEVVKKLEKLKDLAKTFR